tara:strand:- start:1040 stop:1723 length:684 start_codon:yes stop_codon:yes gene_type:complete
MASSPIDWPSAVAAASLWWGCELALLPVAKRRCGGEIIDGMPRWRLVLAYWSQLVGIPLTLLAYVLGAAWADGCFIIIFSVYMVQDLVWFPTLMTKLMVLHHAACLIGLAVACLGAGPEWRSIFGYFFGAVAALELGSAACNLHWLQWCEPKTRNLIYLGTMTASNVFALACVCCWSAVDVAPVGVRVFAVVLTLILTFIRQSESFNCCRVSRGHWFGQPASRASPD